MNGFNRSYIFFHVKLKRVDSILFFLIGEIAS